MTVTINVPPDIEATLLAQAEARGLAVAGYVQNLVRSQIAREAAAKFNSKTTDLPAYELSTEEWLREFRALVASHAGNKIALPDEAGEPESIYGESSDDVHLSLDEKLALFNPQEHAGEAMTLVPLFKNA